MTSSLTPGSRRRAPHRRAAAAALELALLLPVLSYICVITIDYSRIFRSWSLITDAAFNGAMYAADGNVALSSGFTGVLQAVLADAPELAPLLTASYGAGIDSNNVPYVTCTVNYTFTTQFTYPGVPATVPLSRTLQMARSPGY